MTVPALEVRDLCRSYRGGFLARARPALAGVGLALAPGAALGLVGPNGSGKSTLLRIAAGVERPTSGMVRVFGLGLESRAARARLGYLPDGFPFPGELTPRGVLDLLGAVHGLPRAARRRAASELLARVGLAAEERTPLAAFSLGMKRRFALCQALLHAPDVLLLDEPTAGLDAEGYVALDELLGEARARGAALLLATHVLTDVQAHCTDALVLVRGRVRARGPTREVAGDRAQLLALYRDAAESARA